jgi:hypothetical protein
MPVAWSSCLKVTGGTKLRLAEKLSPGNRMMRHSGAAGGLNQAQQKPAADSGSGICSQVLDPGRAAKDMAIEFEPRSGCARGQIAHRIACHKMAWQRTLVYLLAGLRRIAKRPTWGATATRLSRCLPEGIQNFVVFVPASRMAREGRRSTPAPPF